MTAPVNIDEVERLTAERDHERALREEAERERDRLRARIEKARMVKESRWPS